MCGLESISPPIVEQYGSGYQSNKLFMPGCIRPFRNLVEKRGLMGGSKVERETP